MSWLVHAVDFFSLILCSRVVYSSVTAKIAREFFKMTGLLCGMLLALHFYSLLGEKTANIPFLNKQYLDFLSFSVIFFSVQLVFGAIGLAVALFSKKEETPRGNWVLLASGVFRAIVSVSVIIFALQLSSLDSKYFINSVSYRISNKVAPGTYLFLVSALSKYNNSIGFSPNESVREIYTCDSSADGDCRFKHSQ